MTHELESEAQRSCLPPLPYACYLLWLLQLKISPEVVVELRNPDTDQINSKLMKPGCHILNVLHVYMTTEYLSKAQDSLISAQGAGILMKCAVDLNQCQPQGLDQHLKVPDSYSAGIFKVVLIQKKRRKERKLGSETGNS